ncbi:MAG: LLM class flavin-dependent oxidoreductase [Actinomycetia bacterium]|nr:LLM class flavin-dependent oxidoreductase [Actinomycetes bacterium]
MAALPPAVLPTDLSVGTFGADAAEMVEIARVVDRAGYDGIFTLDHFSGSMLGRPWSRELFTLLGAFAATTERVRVGSLVANMVNRHPSLLALSAATVQSLSGGRFVLGVGAGASPGSRFAGEHDAIGRVLDDYDGRRRHLIETIETVRLLWDGGGDYDGRFVSLDGLDGVVGPEPRPPVIVGASGAKTIEVACHYADGVNIRMGPQCLELVGLARQLAADRPFEISVFDNLDLDHSLGGDPEGLVEAGVDRRILAVWTPYPRSAIERIGQNL